MKDANGRPIRIGDIVATPYNSDLPGLAKAIKDAILGPVVEVTEDFQGEVVRLASGVTYEGHEIVTLGGLEWVACEECKFSWPFDARMNDSEECPECETPFRFDQERSY